MAGGAGMLARDRRLFALRNSIPSVGPREAVTLQTQGAALIDVREPDEFNGVLGHIHADKTHDAIAQSLSEGVPKVAQIARRPVRLILEDLIRVELVEVRRVQDP